MLTAAAYTFWVCLFFVFYAYALYPLVLFAAYSVTQIRRDWQYLHTRRNRRVLAREDEAVPAVSMIIPAFNEEACLPVKIANTRRLEYPREKLQVIFVSDGSTDATNEILASLQDPAIQTVFLSQRQGKFNAVNNGVARALHDILVFSDAGTLFAPDALKSLTRRFADPRVGVVCGAVRVEGSAESQQTEGLYWKFESALRLMESRLGATLYASGCIYAVRRQCYQPLRPGDLIDDLIIPMNARKLGYKVLDDPEAVATEFGAESVQGEFARRVRLAVGSFRALKEVAGVPLLNFTGLAFFSHKLARWILPFVLAGLLASNAFLLSRPLYRFTFLAQLCFYAWAALGFVFRRRGQRSKFVLFGYFLVAMHLAFLVGFWRFLFSRTDSAWQRVN